MAALYTSLLCHWQTYTIICLPHKLLNNLRPETMLYLHLILRAQYEIHHEGAINFGRWTKQQDCNILSVCSQSPISGSMNEDRSSWGRVDQQKLTDILFCPSSSWPFSLLSSSSTWQTPFYVPAPVRRVFGVVNVWSRESGQGRVVGDLGPSLSGQPVPSQVRAAVAESGCLAPSKVPLYLRWFRCEMFQWTKVLITCLHVCFYGISINVALTKK